ncbi:diguanylate cyclase with PAS/PAC sensor [Caldalkalibacillus thermarum TA2.A1]|uniref:Diguanylate cyclase with PAS/PAC sensor n=2 Tax=Caldalkalibacillus thermarum (strain TA2.A1) TaxID=986075 RepID=F5LBD0_CALTT|nr:GGDEF domain-containing protein [Caldalkalibacillus thermarum]EGL81351.1 diguanylate cyclase with PAS/PAC sensor [Caldalkalibacillus thermarum TA2.A1]
MFDAKALRPANLLKHWQQLRTLEQALNQAAIIAITDHRGTITYANDAFVKISGYRRDELVGSNHRLVKSGYHDPAFYRQMWRTISSGKVWRDEVCNRTKNGELYWVDTTIVPLLGKNGKPEQYVSIRFDITDKKRLESLVMLDPLTGIGNRRFAEQKIHELIASGQAGDQAALVLIDLDKFKQVNDALGHEAGDLLLKRVAERLQEVKGSNDLLARLAGDEFLIFMPGIGDHSQLKRKLALLKRAFRRPFELQSYRITVWPSMGAALLSPSWPECAGTFAPGRLRLIFG